VLTLGACRDGRGVAALRLDQGAPALGSAEEPPLPEADEWMRSVADWVDGRSSEFPAEECRLNEPPQTVT
jgi:hypothetical protein